MVTIQEYLDNRYPTKEDKEKVKEFGKARSDRWGNKLENEPEGTVEAKFLKQLDGGELNLSEYPNLEKIDIQFSNLNGSSIIKSPLIKLELGKKSKLSYLRCSHGQLTSLDLSGCSGLTSLGLSYNQLTSVEFLNQLSNPEKLEELWIFGNNIQPTDIEVFKPFINLKTLKIGTDEFTLVKGKRNKFYGSFESWKDLSKLKSICIETTDIDSGLEYLPFSLARATANEKQKKEERAIGSIKDMLDNPSILLKSRPSVSYWNSLSLEEKKEKFIADVRQGANGYTYIECSPHNTNAKCSVIRNELWPFNYDLEAWQVANLEKMMISRPELFTSPDSKDRWIEVLDKKIGKSGRELLMTKLIEPGKEKRIGRLENKIQNLTQTKETLEKSTQTVSSTTADKETQTDLSGTDIEKALEIQRQVQILAKK